MLYQIVLIPYGHLMLSIHFSISTLCASVILTYVISQYRSAYIRNKLHVVLI